MAPQKNSLTTTEPITIISPASVQPSSRQNNEPQPGSNPAIKGNSSDSAGQSKPATDGNCNGALPASTHSGSGAAASNRPVTEVIGEGFPPFDHQYLVVGPFTEESNRDAAFEQELAALLLDAIIETHAWAAARPKYESQLAVENLENQISDVIETEKMQGMFELSSRSPSPSLVYSLFTLLFGMGFAFLLFRMPPILLSSSIFRHFSNANIPAEETRERVNDFVVRMKTALAALTGL